MLSEKKIKLAKTFFVITIGTFLILIYLFMFNQGFHVTDALLSDQGLTVSVQNNSSHLIRDIKVFYEDAAGQRILVKEIALLQPDEEETVILQPIYAVDDRIYLFAEAPYHPEVIKEIVLTGPGAKPTFRLMPSISVPQTILVGTPALVSVNLCNEGARVDDIELNAQVDTAYLTIDKTREVFSLAEGDCAVKDFFITGQQAGSSTIYFNIIALSLSEQYSATVQITG
jgi:hypothetical protein